MQLKNTEHQFGLVAIAFHWLLALLIIGLLAVGLYMIDLPSGDEKTTLYGLHKAFGIIVLSLVILRLTWTLLNTKPQLALPKLERIAAQCAHWGLYLLMLVMPLSGWLMSSAADYPPSLFGLYTLPSLVAPNVALKEWFGLIHHWSAYALIALICIHTLAALKHHFIDKNDILRRMTYLRNK